MPRPLPDQVTAVVGPLRPAGDGWTAKCPAHDDNNPSLSLTVTAEDRVLVHCHAGCTQDQVLAALQLDPEVLNGPRDEREVWTPRGPAVAVYDYRDENGRTLFQVLRTADKQFPQRRPDPVARSGWAWNLKGVRRVMFRLPELEAAREAGRSVCITEGEKDALALVGQGRVATCNPGGAGKWRGEYAAHFMDLDVTIFADKDRPGQAHARDIAASLDEVAARVWIVEAPDPFKDISDMLGAGRPLSEVMVTHDPTEPAPPDLVEDMLDFLAGDEPDHDWLVKDLLARGDRLMITGFEGLGKSTWLRQMAVAMSTGFHPVTLARLPAPLRVLIIDCENSRSINRSKYRPIIGAAERDGQPLARGNLWIRGRAEGMNLADPDDAAWLLERVVAVKPDVLVIGPTYRLHNGNPNDEETARQLTAALDEARARVNCAVIVEHHSPHGEQGRNRSVRPVGSSLYMRWPEFGYGLKPADDNQDPLKPMLVRVQPWRGPRDERTWPLVLRRGSSTGSSWPWIEDVPGGPSTTTGLRLA